MARQPKSRKGLPGMTDREWLRHSVIQALANPATVAEQISFYNSRIPAEYRISDVEKWAMAREISQGIAALDHVPGQAVE